MLLLCPVMIGIHPYVLNTLSSGAAEHPHLLSVLLWVIACVTTDMTWMTAEWMATPRKQIAMLADCRRSPQVLQLRCIEWKWCLGHCLGEKIQMSVNYSIKPRSRCQRPAVTKWPVFYSSRWHDGHRKWVCLASLQSQRLWSDVGQKRLMEIKT